MKTNRLKLLPALITAAAMASTAHAFDNDLTWHTVDGGGGTVVGGAFELSGSIGQHDVGAMTGGTFELSGGFWHFTRACFCPGDLNNDGLKDGADIQLFVNCQLSDADCSCADIDLVGGVTLDDTVQFVADLLAGATCSLQ